MKVIALAGGVGGAKLIDGLARILKPSKFTIIVNTGDDFHHFGLYISPDLDTVCYTLAKIANSKTGWGRKKETWNALNNIDLLGGPTWFSLGDNDLGTHLERTRRITRGESLTSITRAFCRKWEVGFSVYPMCDQRVETLIKTKEYGWLNFQEYFANKKCSPTVQGFKFRGMRKSHLDKGLKKKIREADLVVICPSNPWVSIDPILKVKGVNGLIKNKMVIAVSPIAGTQAFKGPAAKMFAEMGKVPNVISVAEHYKGIVKIMIIDNQDRKFIPSISRWGIISLSTNIYMKSPKDRVRLAKFLLESINRCRENN
jgi:LPPG:FO 2-phospho-L-lactate transferase